MSGGTVSPDERGAMLRIETECELRDGRVLYEGEVVLTVDSVDGDSVTGWFRPDWWDRNTARALVLDTPCKYEGKPVPCDENGEWTNTLACECATCLVDEFPYDDWGWHGAGAEVTLTLPKTEAKKGDRIVVGVLLTRERLTGGYDRHGITSGLSSTTYCGSVSWDEWQALEACETTRGWLAYDAQIREDENPTEHRDW